MIGSDRQQEKPQDFELMELLFQKALSKGSNAADQLDKSFEARYQSLVDQIQSYLHSSEKPGFFPHRFLGLFSSVLDTKLNEKLGIERLHFRFEGARTLKVVAQTKLKTHVFIFTEDTEAQHSNSPQARTRNFEFTTGEWEAVMGRGYTPLDERKLQIDVIKIIKDKKGKDSGEDKRINIEVERKKIKNESIAPPKEFPFQEITKKLGKSVYLESYIEKLASSDTRQARENLKEILTYIKKVHADLNLQGNVYGIKAREANQHGFVAGIFDNFRYRDNTKIYLEQFAGRGYADIILLVRGPDRAVDSIPILIELKAGTQGQKLAPGDALKQAEDYVKGFRPNKMRFLTNAKNAIVVGLNLDQRESFEAKVVPIRPSLPLMDNIIELSQQYNNQQISEEDFKQQITDLLSSEYYTFSANKETRDNYYFSREILGQSILTNNIDQGNIKKYIYSYGEYPLNWPGGTEYTLSKSPVMTLIFIHGNEGEEKTAFIFHIRESNTKKFYTDKKIPVTDIPGIGRIGNVIEAQMSLVKYQADSSFQDIFKIERVSKYNPSNTDLSFTGDFLEIPNSDELKGKFDQAITSQHASSSDNASLTQAYNELLTEIANVIYPIRHLITNEARLQAILNGLFSSYSDLKLKETSHSLSNSAKVVVISEFQVGAGGRVDMVIQGIGPSPQGTKEYTPIALEFKLINKNLDEEGMKKEGDKLTKEQNVRYAKGAALKTITDSDKMLFMGVVVNVGAKDKNSLILTSDELVSAVVVHSSIDIAKRKHLEGIKEVTQKFKSMGIQEGNLRTFESETAAGDYRYWLQQHDIGDIARIQYGYRSNGDDTLFEIVGSPEHIANQLQQFRNSVTTSGERRPLTLVVNLNNLHWVTLVISYQNGRYDGYYVDSLGDNIPDNINRALQQAQITAHDVSVSQQADGYNCGLWALENAHSLNQMIANGYDSSRVRDLLLIKRNEAYFQEQREEIFARLSIDQERIDNLEIILAEVQQNLGASSSKCHPSSRKKRNVGMTCIDSHDEEKITEEEKENLIKELFGIESHDKKIIIVDSPQVSIKNGKVYVKVKGNDEELIVGNAANIQNIENYILDKINLEVKLRVSSDTEYAIIEEIKDQGSEYYLNIDGYKIKLDNIIKGFTTDVARKVIYDRLHQLSNNKELLENKKYIEDIGGIQDIGAIDKGYDDLVNEIKKNLLKKGISEDIFNRFQSYSTDLSGKVFAEYIGNVKEGLRKQGIAFDHDKFDSAKIKGAKSGKFFSLMAIYDLLDSIVDTTTLGRHDNDALKQIFGINGILDAMDDVRNSVSISPNSKVGKLMGKIPQPLRQSFVQIISNPIVQGITFATIAYQFGYSVNEIIKGNHHPLNYYWIGSNGVKLASMSVRPMSIGISAMVKSASSATKILRGLSVASRVLSKASVITMVADILITAGVKLHERMEYTKAIAAQVPLSPGNEQAEVFFAEVVKFFTGKDVEKKYEDKIRIKGYLDHVKKVAVKLLKDDYNIAAVVQYITFIKENYSEIIKNGEKVCSNTRTSVMPNCQSMCELEKKFNNISFSSTTSNVNNDLSSFDISKTLSMKLHTLVMNEGWERFICDTRKSFSAKSGDQCHKELNNKEVYVVDTDAKHIPHLTKGEYQTGLRIVKVPLKYSVSKPQCGKIINEKKEKDNRSFLSRLFNPSYSPPCNTDKVYRECQETFTLSDEPFIFTYQKRQDSFHKNRILYLSGSQSLTASANYPAVMPIPEGRVNYVGSKNHETTFIMNDYTSGTLIGGVGKDNTLVMNAKADHIVVNLHNQNIRYANRNEINLVEVYNYVSNSDSRKNIVTHCKTRLINAKNSEVRQGALKCQPQDYEVQVVNEKNVHYRGSKQIVFIFNKDSGNAEIVGDLKIKENTDIIDIQVDNITQWGISEDIEKKGSYSLDLYDTQGVVSSIKINNFKSLAIRVNCSGIIEFVAIDDKSLPDMIEDIRYQKLKNSGEDISKEVIQNSKKNIRAVIQAVIIGSKLLNAYQVAKDIAHNSKLDIPIPQVEVIRSDMGIPTEKVIIADMYSDQVIVDFSHSSSDVTDSYRDNQERKMACSYYQDIMVEGEKGQHQYIIKLPEYDHHEILSSPAKLNLKIKNKAVPYQSIPYATIDFTELNVIDVNDISIKRGKRSYVNECYNKLISDLTEDSLEIKNIMLLDSKGIKWSLSIGLIDYFETLEHQQVVLQMNNQLYKIDSTNLKLEHVAHSLRYYQLNEQGLQIYHNQPVNKNDIGLVDLKEWSILDCDLKVIDDSLLLLHKNNTLVKVENWNTYQPTRKMMFAFNDAKVSNLECIVSTCNSEGVIASFNKMKANLLKTHQRSRRAIDSKISVNKNDPTLFTGKNNTTAGMGYGITNGAEGRPSLINDLFNWAKNSVKHVYDYFARGDFFRDNADYVNVNLKQTHERQMPIKFELKDENNTVLEMGDHYLSQVDFNGTIMLFDLFSRKVTGQKFIPSVDQSISLLDAQASALSIVEKFEQVLNETAIKSGISVTNVKFNPISVQSTIVGQIINGKFSKISKTLYSAAKEACPEFKQIDKFLNYLNDRLKEVLAEKEVELLSEKQKPINVDKAKPAFPEDKPNIFLNDTSISKGLNYAEAKGKVSGLLKL